MQREFESGHGYPLAVHVENARILERELAALSLELEGVKRERDELAAWKESAMAVERSWDAQEVGRLLGLPLGSDIRAQIAQSIATLRQQLAAMTAASDEQLRSNAQNWQTILDLRAERDRLQVELGAEREQRAHFARKLSEEITLTDSLRAQNAQLIAELQKLGKG